MKVFAGKSADSLSQAKDGRTGRSVQQALVSYMHRLCPSDCGGEVRDEDGTRYECVICEEANPLTSLSNNESYNVRHKSERDFKLRKIAANE